MAKLKTQSQIDANDQKFGLKFIGNTHVSWNDKISKFYTNYVCLVWQADAPTTTATAIG